MLDKGAVCLSAAALVAAQSPEPAPMRPSGPWVAAFEHGSCQLERTYGSPAQPVRLVIEQIPTSRAVAAYIFETRRGGGYTEDKVMIGFGPGQAAVESRVQSGELPTVGMRFHRTGLSRQAVERATVHQLISFEIGRGPLQSFALPGVAKAIAMLDECHVDLLASWGLSRDIQNRTSQFPSVAEGHSVAFPDEYPEQAMRRGISGKAIAYVHVDPAGKASNCKVAVTSGERSIDKASCDALLHTRFKPALDTAGKPIASIYANSLRWLMIGN